VDEEAIAVDAEGEPRHAHTGDGARDGAHEDPDIRREQPFGPARRMVAIGGGVTVACVDQGKGPTILFLHGFPTSSMLWRKTIAHLATGHRCVAPDLLGFGDTEGPVESDFGIEAHAARAVALLDALGIAGEVAVVGHDWGGSIAQALVATAPERIGALVLIDCPAFEADEPAVVRRIALAARVPFVWDLAADSGLLLYIAKSAGGMRAGAVDDDALTDAAIEEYMRPLVKDTPPAYRASRERFRRAILGGLAGLDAALERAAEALRRFEKPTLVVWGCDDPYVSLSWGKRLADTIPGCVGFELLPFCGHWVPEEKSADLAGLIASHLDGGARASAIADALLASIGRSGPQGLVSAPSAPEGGAPDPTTAAASAALERLLALGGAGDAKGA